MNCLTAETFQVVSIALELSGFPESAHPFLDVEIWGRFRHENGAVLAVRGFYDGGRTWRVRFTPTCAGNWEYHLHTQGEPEVILQSGQIAVRESAHAGFFRAAPDSPWGFRRDRGDAPWLLGDTIYNLFGAVHSGADGVALLRQRRDYGFNLIRARLQVSPAHPGTPYSGWMNNDCWLWGGSPQSPDYTQFNLRYLQTVDRVLAEAEALGVGFELIFEAWLFEQPFSQRDKFLPEMEELMFEYLTARFAAFPSVWYWTVANEYNLYRPSPLDPLNDRYARRLARLVRQSDPYGHPVSTHVTAAERMQPVFGERFRECRELDLLLMQYWGDISSRESAALAAGIEEEMVRSVGRARQSVIFSEYGYEAGEPPAFPPGLHAKLGPDHNRRGALRAIFQGYPVITGFDNLWGPAFEPNRPPPGTAQFRCLRALLESLLDYRHTQPWRGFLADREFAPGARPSALFDESQGRLAVYFPVAQDIRLEETDGPIWRGVRWRAGDGVWFDPANGNLLTAKVGEDRVWKAPGGCDLVGLPKDWVLLLSSARAENSPAQPPA